MSEATKRLEKRLKHARAREKELVRASRELLYALDEKLDDETVVQAIDRLDRLTRVVSLA